MLQLVSFCQPSIVFALVIVSVVGAKHHDSKQRGKEMVYFHLQLHSTVHHGWKSEQELTEGKNMESGADSEAMVEYCWLACSSWLAQPDFL